MGTSCVGGRYFYHLADGGEVVEGYVRSRVLQGVEETREAREKV